MADNSKKSGPGWTNEDDAVLAEAFGLIGLDDIPQQWSAAARLSGAKRLEITQHVYSVRAYRARIKELVDASLDQFQEG